MKNQALELHSPLPNSFKVCKERTTERGKTEDDNCSLLSQFWSTSRSPFFTCYIPFQISGSQKSNASNRARFGAEMRKIWPSEDNYSRLVRKFRKFISQLGIHFRTLSSKFSSCKITFARWSSKFARCEFVLQLDAVVLRRPYLPHFISKSYMV